MDFAKPLVWKEGVATKSNIRLIPEEKWEDDDDDDDVDKKNDLDRMLIRAANRAAMDLMVGSRIRSGGGTTKCEPKEEEEEEEEEELQMMVDCKNYPERLLCGHSSDKDRLIKEGDLVVICESFDSLDFVYAKRGDIFSNRNGHFHHDDFIGKYPYGCKLRSRNNRGYGFVYLLKPTPELWVKSLNHRTQIIHELDIAHITCQLQLRPNMMVLEAGTGSGAMTHAFCRIVAPHGKVHTFDFHKDRVQQARSDFAKNGLLPSNIQVHHADVCTEGFLHHLPDHQRRAAHAIFLDLPEPWKAIPHAVQAIRPNGRIATYSPCIEQSQRTIEQMKHHGFHTIHTVEVRLREYHIDDVEFELPPTTKWKRPPSTPAPHNHHGPVLDSLSSHTPNKEDSQNITTTTTTSNNDMSSTGTPLDYITGDDTGAEADNEKSEAEGETTEGESTWVPDEDERTNKITTTSRGHKNNNDNTKVVEVPPPKKRKMLCARPFSVMRGHTAFLTFATAGLSLKQTSSTINQ